MPTVPTYGDRRVNQTALPNTRVNTQVSLESTGGGAGLDRLSQSSNNLTQQAIQIHDEERQYANKQFALEVRNKLNSYEINDVRGEKGFASRQGKNALGLREELNGSYKKFREEALKGAMNDDQKAMANELMDARGAQFQKWAATHTQSEIGKYEQQNFISALESSKERGSMLLENSPQERAFIEQTVSERAEKLGLGEDAKKQLMQSHVSELHARSITELINSKQYPAAQAHFDKIKNDKYMDPDVILKVKKTLADGMLRGESQQAVEDIVGKTSSLSTARDMARAKYKDDPIKLDEVKRRLEIRYKEEEYRKTENMNNSFNKAAQILKETKNLDNVPPALLEGMTKKRQKALKTIELLSSQGLEAKTNPFVKYDLQQLFLNPNTQDQVKNLNLTDYIAELSPSDLSYFGNLQADINGNKNGKELGLLRTNNKYVNDRISEAGIDPKSDKGKLFYNRVEQITMGQELTREKLQAVIDEQLMTVTVEGGGMVWGDKDYKAFELPSEKIPANDYMQIKQLLESQIEADVRAGRSPRFKANESTIRRVYLQKLAQKNGGTIPKEQPPLNSYNAGLGARR